jgi:hypothetical protein
MTTVSQWEEKPQEFQVWCPHEFDISASAVSVPFFAVSNLRPIWGNRQTTTKIVIKEVLVAYTEATDASNAGQVRVGNDANATQYNSYTTPSGKSIGDVDVIDQADFDVGPLVVDPAKWLQVRGGGGTGTGQYRVGLTLTYDYTDYYDFDEATGS